MAGKLTNKATWETVSYIPRTLHYAVTVRDANAQRPMLSSLETTVTVGDDGSFKFSGITGSTTLYNNAANTILWDVLIQMQHLIMLQMLKLNILQIL
jgi:hypothetical protein